MSKNKANQYLKIDVADLILTLDARHTSILIKLPDTCHKPFLISNTAEAHHASAVSRSLVLMVSDVDRLTSPPNNKPICRNDFFSVFYGPEGNLTFFAERERLPFLIRIDPDFTSGSIEGCFDHSGAAGLYPLQSMGIVLYANWLAQFGDLILHASGFAWDGKGYAFVGSAGAGKSTLMETVVEQDAGRVLGEDQVILRYLEDRFWIFGTPWHERPGMCMPLGVPLEKLLFLDRDEQEVCTSIAPFVGVQRLMQTAFIPYYRADRLPHILDRLALLADHVPFYSLSYRLGTDVLSIINLP